ncbi:MAG TPA: hypothetical protein VF646_16300 [Cytophagales bacterium]|jgi:hypothetical protein
MKAILPLTALALTLFAACEPKELSAPAGETQPESTAANTRLVFGQYYGFCPPTSDCAQVYKLEGNHLYEDEVLRVPGRDAKITFKTDPLPADQYDRAKALADNIPAELLTSTGETFGSPDSFDQGGIVLEITRDGQTKRFLLDNDETALPPGLVPYAQEVKRVVAALK